MTLIFIFAAGSWYCRCTSLLL